MTLAELLNNQNALGGRGTVRGALQRFLPSYQPQQGQQQAEQYIPQEYQAPPAYRSFAELFGLPMQDYSNVTDVYQRGALPNQLLDRYNAMSMALQEQQRKMMASPKRGYNIDIRSASQPTGNYVNFANLFSGR